MRPHVSVTLAPGTPHPRLPHWTKIMRDKAGAEMDLTPAIGAALQRLGQPAWTTHEYLPRTAAWNEDEMRSGLDRVFRLILQRSDHVPPDLVSAIKLTPGVVEVRPGIIGTAALPEVRTLGRAVKGDDSPRRQIFLPEARRVSEGTPQVKVAVLDTGVAVDHPDLAANMDAGNDLVDIIDGQSEFIGDFIGADPEPLDEVGHGTHVAGIVAANGNGSPRGVAPLCRIMPVRVLAAMRRGAERIGAGLVENINAGVKWAVDQGADIINMSLGVQHTGGGLPHSEVVQYAARRGVCVIAASGNDGTEALYYPGALPEVIAVGSSNSQGGVSGFSTFGPQVALIAPGEDIYSTYLDNGYAHATGTSHASPFVAGAAALLQSVALRRGGRFSPHDIRRILTETADRQDQRMHSRRAGSGQLNLADALRLAQSIAN